MLGHDSKYEKGHLHASETKPATIVIPRTRLGAIVLRACMLAFDRRATKAVETASACWSSPTGQGRAGVRNGALVRFERLRMDGDEKTSVERQDAGPAGISSSCHALCTGPCWWLREQSREVPSCHRDRSVAIGADAEIALRRRVQRT